MQKNWLTGIISLLEIWSFKELIPDLSEIQSQIQDIASVAMAQDAAEEIIGIHNQQKAKLEDFQNQRKMSINPKIEKIQKRGNV